ncbi:hypothetical protein F4809DRAFT_658608 [Biscogniauxia mediterranea]|nr:hypothetical protein F4809DRAFT_658608 [Biscogniauxia mediterranea]
MAGTHDAAQMLAIRDTGVDVVDTRPQISPYASPLVTFHFGDGPPFHVPEAFVNKAPKLYARRNSSDNSINLKDTPGNCGHVLIHYLCTGQYQCLKPYGSFPCDRHIIEFETSVRVYSITRAYDIRGLGILCRSEIERLGQSLHAAQALKIIVDLYTNPTASDIWLPNYLKSLAKEFMDGPPSMLSSILSEQPNQAPSIDRFLLKATIELYHERVDTPQRSCAPPSVLPGDDQRAQGRQETTTTDVVVKPIHNTQMIFKGSPQEPTSPDLISDTTEGKIGKDQEEAKEEESELQIIDETPLSTYEFKMEVPASFPSLGLQDKGQRTAAEGIRLFENLSLSSESNPSTPCGVVSCQTLDASGRRPNNNPSAPIAGFETRGFSYQDVVHIPLTTGAYAHYDAYEAQTTTTSRFLHICMQKPFERFSPEELRLRHGALEGEE